MKYRIVYNDSTILEILANTNSVTYTSDCVIVDTLENAKTALEAIGIDTTKIDEYES